MGEQSHISWTDATFNPWIGCAKVSPACKRCYAEVSTFTRRSRSHGLELWGENAERHTTSESNWKQPTAWNKAAERDGKRLRVFCASLADVFEGRADLDGNRARLWKLIESTPALDWLLLTKRPENIRQMIPREWLDDPRLNVMFGTTVESQEYAESRIPHLLGVPAERHFVSVEPMLGEIDLDPPRCSHCRDGGEIVLGGPPWCVQCDSEAEYGHWLDACDGPDQPGIGWVLCGGESQTGARPMHPVWARRLRDQCVQAHVPFHFKQWGEWRQREISDPDSQPMIRLETDGSNDQTGEGGDGRAHHSEPVWMQRVGKKAAGNLLDGRQWLEFPEARS